MPHPKHEPPLHALHTGEFVRGDEAARIAVAHLGPNGRCYGSLSAHHAHNRDHLTVRNANVCTAEHGKLWWGDCDVTLVAPELRALARALGVTVYVLPERAARFLNAALPDLAQALYVTDGSDEGFTPTHDWAYAAREKWRHAIERQPGRMTVRSTSTGLQWTRVNQNGDPCPITTAEARAEFRARGWAWDPTWDPYADD